MPLLIKNTFKLTQYFCEKCKREFFVESQFAFYEILACRNPKCKFAANIGVEFEGIKA